MIDEFNRAHQAEKSAKTDKDEASKAIKTIMKDHEIISYNNFVVSHKTMQRKKTKMVEIPNADPIVMRRFSIKDVG